MSLNFEIKRNKKFWKTLDSEDSGAEKENFSKKNVSASPQLSIRTLTEGIKPMIFEKKESKYREDSILIRQFGISFRILEIRNEAELNYLWSDLPLQNETAGWDFDGRNQNGS